MDKWRTIAIVLSVFGFLKDFRPSDPFLVQFLNGPWHNISTQQINQDLFPVGTYSYGIQLVITFLVTDYFRYKPLIILSGLAGVVHWALFIWTKELKWLQLGQVLYGTYKAADVAFWSYIYVRVERNHYQKITSYTKSASMVGKFAAAVGSQVLLFYGLVDYLELNYISLAVQTCTTAIALFLPSAPKSIYFNRTPSTESTDSPQLEKASTSVEDPGALELLWFHVKSAYTNFTVLRYSLWSALASCIYYQTMLYVQVLWRTIGGEPTVVHWNGAVEAILTLCGAAITFSAGFVPAKAFEIQNALAGLCWVSFAQGGILLGAALTRSIWVAYGAHVLYCVLHSFTMTLLSAEIAKNICRDSFGLVFGINATVGSVLQIMVTLGVVDGSGLFITDISGQFVVYSCVCGAMGVLFCVFLLVELRSWWKYLFLSMKDKLIPKKKNPEVDRNANRATA